MTYGKFKNSSDAVGDQLDLLVGKALKRVLPFLYGEKGHFDSLGHFRDAMYVRSMLPQVAIDYHRHGTALPRHYTEKDNSYRNGTKVANREGFQPTLFRLREEQTEEKQALERLLLELENPDIILGLDYLRRSPRRRRALELFCRHNAPGTLIPQVLESEGWGTVKPSAIRLWIYRAKRF